MTREEILNMKAGREMDLLIDDKVFGMINLSTDKLLESDLLPYYSTDIGAAWKVVEKIESVGGVDVMLRSSVRGWLVVIEEKRADYHANSDTAPLAICRAALLAVMK